MGHHNPKARSQLAVLDEPERLWGRVGGAVWPIGGGGIAVASVSLAVVQASLCIGGSARKSGPCFDRNRILSLP